MHVAIVGPVGVGKPSRPRARGRRIADGGRVPGTVGGIEARTTRSMGAPCECFTPGRLSVSLVTSTIDES